MKYMLALIIAVSLLLGCGHRTGNNPQGVTGGGSNGYGTFGTNFTENFPILLGAWHQDVSDGIENIVTFRSDGILNVNFGVDQSSQNGSYYVSGNQIDINVYGWKSGSGEFAIDGNTMTVTLDDEAITLHK